MTAPNQTLSPSDAASQNAPIPSLRERQKMRRRNRIFTVAIQMFKERGFDRTTATDIAKVAHVSRGTFFNYYPYKEAVLLDYGSQIISELREKTSARRNENVAPMNAT
jgi:AcrR family transcriptional regulator